MQTKIFGMTQLKTALIRESAVLAEALQGRKFPRAEYVVFQVCLLNTVAFHNYDFLMQETVFNSRLFMRHVVAVTDEILRMYRKNLKVVSVSQLTGQETVSNGSSASSDEPEAAVEESIKVAPEPQIIEGTTTPDLLSKRGVDAARERYLARKQLMQSRPHQG